MESPFLTMLTAPSCAGTKWQKEKRMNEARKKRKKRRRTVLFINLFTCFVGPLLTLPGYGLAEDSKGPLAARVDKPVMSLVEGTSSTEEEAPLLNETLKLEAVVAYAQTHNPAVR